MQCSRMKPDERPTAQQLLDHSWLEETDGNRLCELLPPEEAPDDVPDVDIFPKLQPQLPQIMEEDEDLQDGAALPLSQSEADLPAARKRARTSSEWGCQESVVWCSALGCYPPSGNVEVMGSGFAVHRAGTFEP
ncbi:HSP90 [Symbiodinium necroappetens]|uniref:HSP90 protein n=1 Tax=Symbiodinium necroappetens TaxID=1628268 RepID=A0A812NBS0_9DINO|nr:HSP90 [Symbiodinium necroappetens]